MNISALKVINEVMKLLNNTEVHTYIHILSLYIQSGVNNREESIELPYAASKMIA